ncbi:ribosome small subunit-dependent GTPase A [Vibrio coralliilyticus]|uniref:ribosome small subunit-dependent GTPase A n=1 Tax=Vibrio coralliilyticus TaxID=190893 RepID=UPI001E2989D9|nr:ribosome small subunit-dependent GTPase A [Vibrio coralliilyticus]MCC2524284.1 ribosome small subunit-dependent GTPase A [Vibrio coralliilyticus]
MCTSKTTNGRIIEKSSNAYKVQTDDSIRVAQLRGRYAYAAKNKSELPCVGDWIEAKDDGDTFLIEKVLPRKSLVSRHASGEATVQQPIAANIDYVFIVLGLDGGRNYSDRLLERLLTVGWNSGATPVVLLNKSDVNENADLVKMQAETVALGVDIINCSATEGTGVDELLSYLCNGKVGIFIGPSGVGKSTLTNTLLQRDTQATNRLRLKDQRGRHTTSGASMFEVGNGGFIVDCAGIKEVQAWASTDDIDAVFEEISTLSKRCKFRNCQHQGEDGCAVQQELEIGNLTPERYDSYLHLKQEVAFLDRRRSEKNRSVERQYDKALSKMKTTTLSRKGLVRQAMR